MSKLACAVVLAFGLLVTPLIARAAEPPPVAKDGDVVVRDFAFTDGERLGSMNLHYVTLGTPTHDASGAVGNAVMLLHGTTGSASQFLDPGFAQVMFGPGQPLDTSRFFVVIPDGIGAGGSSKPSDGLGGRFPHYGYKDQVLAQHALLEQIGVTHLKLVLGTSMGGMQAWLWGETYPDDMDALVVVASTPAAISGRNMMWRDMIIQAIRTDPDWKDGNYSRDTPPKAWIRTAIPLFAIMTGNAEHLQDLAPTREATIAAVDAMEDRAKNVDANDYLYAFESSADYDPAPQLGEISKPMLAINFADDLLNPPELLHLPATENLDQVMLPAGHDSFGHLTLRHPAAWADPLRRFLNKIPGWRS